MYRTILLAYEGSLAGRRALREGANIAIKFGAATHLLAVMKPSLTANMGHDFDGGHLVDEELKYFRDTLSEGVDLLKEWGLDAEGHLVWGDPAAEISRTSREVDADLVVVGHDPQGGWRRWWHTPLSSSLLDKLDCSLLIATHGPAVDEVASAQ